MQKNNNKSNRKNQNAFFLPIKTKIIVPVVFVILFAGTVASIITFRITRDYLIQREEISIDQLNGLKVESIENFITDRLQLLEAIGKNDYLVKEIFENPESVEQQTEILEGYNINNQYLAIYIMDPTGLTLVSTDSTFVGNNYSFREYFKKAINGQPNVDVAIGVTSKQLGYYFAAPIQTSGEILGVVVLKLDPKQISEQTLSNEYNVTEHPETNINFLLTDQNGVVISSGDESEMFKFTGKVSEQVINKLIEERRYENYNLENLRYNEIQNAINEQQIHKHSEYSANGDSKILILTKIKEYPFYLISESNLQEINNYASVNARTLSIIVLTTAGITVLVLIFAINKVVKPLEHLVQSIREAEKAQEVDPKSIPVGGNDEIAELASSMKDLATKLVGERRHVEEKVKNQTTLVERQKLALMNILEDIQEEQQNADEATRELEKFKLAADNVSEVIIISDSNGVVLYANDAVEKTTGYSPNEVVGKKAGGAELWGGNMSKKFYANLWDTIKNKKRTFTGEITNTRKGGEEYVAQTSISPILDRDGNVKFFVAIERDITQMKMIDSMKTEFISLASHQLRTPLSAMKWFLEMLLGEDAGKLTKDQKEYLTNVNDSNERMIGLVNALLDVSRIESGRIIVDPKLTDIKELVNSVVLEVQKEMKKRKQKLDFEIDPEIKEINIDPKLIRNVYQNLLSNAIKFTPDQGKISVKIAKNNGDMISEIKDTGYGIPKHEQNKVFEKFFRGENIATVITEGNGLGLYMVKAIVESSGGKVWFESTLNKGTTFWFTLPLEGMKPKEGTVTLNS